MRDEQLSRLGQRIRLFVDSPKATEELVQRLHELTAEALVADLGPQRWTEARSGEITFPDRDALARFVADVETWTAVHSMTILLDLLDESGAPEGSPPP